ncbi:MAG: pilus assembly protein [Gammaproteobacteria bacterium]|nr:pilus assembly protein [Gammaproteobacteria bacterium]
MKRRQRGQSLVEFGMSLPIMLALVFAVFTTFMLAGNLLMAKQMSARGARAASVFLADGSRTCLGDVANAIGDPGLPSASWTHSVTANCDGNPFATFVSGEPVTVTIDVSFTPFWGQGSWPLSLSTTDQAR